MKIGIITLHHQTNYGAVLQSYALQRVLKNHGCDVEVINFWLHNTNTLHSRLLEGDRSTIKWPVDFMKYLFFTGKVRSRQKRRRKTLAFLQHHIRTSTTIYKTAAGLKQISGYDIIIAGSDQIWNPFWHGIPNPFLLDLEDKEIKKTAYAASFGVSELPVSRKIEYAKALAQFQYISVREKAGLKIVEQLTGKKPEHVLDPSLLLTAQEWGEVVNHQEDKPDKPYLLCYWLGDLSIILNLLIQLGKRKEMRIKLFGAALPTLYGRCWSLLSRILLEIHPRITCCFDAGPIEFVSGIKNSSGVISDSFHAMMFATIFQKPMKIFVNSNPERGKTGSRLLGFAKTFNLQECVEQDTPRTKINLANPDFERVQQLIEMEKKQSLEFLLGIIK